MTNSNIVPFIGEGAVIFELLPDKSISDTLNISDRLLNIQNDRIVSEYEREYFDK